LAFLIFLVFFLILSSFTERTILFYLFSCELEISQGKLGFPLPPSTHTIHLYYFSVCRDKKKEKEKMAGAGAAMGERKEPFPWILI
jgi:phosphatidylethanolamine-binding protein (PEBP) family uncharacterized protein